jgi:hypothetical protein
MLRNWLLWRADCAFSLWVLDLQFFGATHDAAGEKIRSGTNLAYAEKVPTPAAPG